MAPEYADALTARFTRSLIRTKARQLARRREFWSADIEDIEADLQAHLVQHIEKFDPNRAQLNTFISRVLDTAVAMLLRDGRRAKRAAGHNVRSTETLRENVVADPVCGGASVCEDDGLRRLGRTSTPFEERIVLRESVRQIVSRLSDDRLVRVARLLSDGGSIASIARDLEISRRQVRGLIAQIRERFVAGGFGDA